MMSRKTTPGAFLSVIMPAHNAENTVKRAALTTLRAMPRDSELLIFLDACTDKTKDIVSTISDRRLKILEGTEQHGVSAALNVLLAHATGTYIARMDADDICLPWRFTHQLRKISKTKGDFLFGNAVLFGSRLKPFGFAPQIPFPLSSKQSLMALLLGNPFVHPAMIAKASSMRQIGGYREAPAEDYDLWLRAAIDGMRIERSSAYAVLYRVHSRQLTQQTVWQERLENDTTLRATKAALAERLLGRSPQKSWDTFEISRKLWNFSEAGLAVRWGIFRAIGTTSFLRLVKKDIDKSV